MSTNYFLVNATFVDCIKLQFHENCLIGCRVINIFVAIPVFCLHRKVPEKRDPPHCTDQSLNVKNVRVLIVYKGNPEQL